MRKIDVHTISGMMYVCVCLLGEKVDKTTPFVLLNVIQWLVDLCCCCFLNHNPGKEINTKTIHKKEEISLQVFILIYLFLMIRSNKYRAPFQPFLRLCVCVSLSLSMMFTDFFDTF